MALNGLTKQKLIEKVIPGGFNRRSFLTGTTMFGLGAATTRPSLAGVADR